MIALMSGSVINKNNVHMHTRVRLLYWCINRSIVYLEFSGTARGVKPVE